MHLAQAIAGAGAPGLAARTLGAALRSRRDPPAGRVGSDRESTHGRAEKGAELVAPVLPLRSRTHFRIGAQWGLARAAQSLLRFAQRDTLARCPYTPLGELLTDLVNG